MAKDIPDYMRGFDLDDDWGMTPVSNMPKQETTIDPKAIDNQNLELSKVKSDVSSIKSMMNEVMQIVADKESVSKEINDEDVKNRFKDVEKLILPSQKRELVLLQKKNQSPQHIYLYRRPLHICHE